jgi:threonine/homoserine/homoserine lactone efflux protein
MLTAVLLGITASVMPSPHNFYTLYLGLNQDYKEVRKACYAGLLVDLCLVVISGLLTYTIKDSAFIVVIYIVGGSFCLLMAYRLIRIRGISFESVGGQKSFLAGLFAQLINPNPYIFWTSIAWPLILQQPSVLASIAFPIVFLFFVYFGKYSIARFAGNYGSLLLERALGLVKTLVIIGLVSISYSFFREAFLRVQDSLS